MKKVTGTIGTCMEVKVGLPVVGENAEGKGIITSSVTKIFPLEGKDDTCYVETKSGSFYRVLTIKQSDMKGEMHK